MKKAVVAFALLATLVFFASCSAGTDVMNTERKILADAIRQTEEAFGGMEDSDILKEARQTLLDPSASSDEIAAAISSISMLHTSAKEQHIVFVDPALEQHVRRILGKPSGAFITAAETEKITELDLSFDPQNTEISSRIVYTDDLKWFPNVVSLNLSGNAVRDLTGIAKLEKLHTLNLSGTFSEIVDVNASFLDFSPLSVLTELTELDLSDNGIVDLSSLSSLGSVQILDLSGNNLSSLWALRSMKSLRSLSLDGAEIVDLSPLYGLENLSSLTLRACRFSKVCGLENLTQLRELDLSGSTGINAEWLATLSGLEHLNVSQTGLKGLSFASSLFNLKTLDVSRNKITGLSAVLSLPLLEQLDASQNSVTSVSLGETALKKLNLSSNRLSSLTFTAENSTLQELLVGGNKLRSLSIRSLHALQTLDAQRNLLSDVSGLSSSTLRTLNLYDNVVRVFHANLPALQELSLEYNPLSDISGLSASTDLRKLNLNDTRIYSFAPLLEFENLEDLTVDLQYAEDLYEISRFTSLKTLTLYDFYGNYWDILDPLKDSLEHLAFNSEQIVSPQITGFSKLQTLKFVDCIQLSDLSGIRDLPALEVLYTENAKLENPNVSDLLFLKELSLVACGVKDVSFLYRLPQLTHLNLQKNNLEHLAFADFPSLRYLNLADNGLRSLEGFSLVMDGGYLDLSGNFLSDFSPLSVLSDISVLDVSRNKTKELKSYSGLSVTKIISD